MTSKTTIGPESSHAAVLAAREANAYRARTLYRLAQSQMTFDEFLHAAQQDHTLRRLSLRSVLLALPGIGDATVRRVIDKTVKIANENNQSYRLKSITVAWLLDEKDYGRRFEALAEALSNPTTTAYGLGFPYNPVEVKNAGPLTGE